MLKATPSNYSPAKLASIDATSNVQASMSVAVLDALMTSNKSALQLAHEEKGRLV